MARADAPRAHRLRPGPVPLQLIRVEVLERRDALKKAWVGAVLHAQRIHLPEVACPRDILLALLEECNPDASNGRADYR